MSTQDFKTSKEEKNKAIVARWFESFWGKDFDLGIVDELAAPDMLMRYSLHEERNGREDIKDFIKGFREAFPDLMFAGTADLLADGDYVIGQWKGGGTHTGSAFDDFIIGSLPKATGKKLHFSGITILKVENGKITQEIGLDDGLTAMEQLGLIKKV